MSNLRLGLIGLDTSHVEGFAALLHKTDHPDHVPGARIVAAFSGGSPDFALSIDRVGGYTRLLRDEYGVQIMASPRAVAEAVDAVLITTVDGRLHLDQFRETAPLRKPVFIDKPFTTTTADARAIAELAAKNRTPWFSSSSLRFSGSLQHALRDATAGAIVGADFSGPLKLQPTQPGFFWYGIHMAEMLYAAMGAGCLTVAVTATADHEVAVGTWGDGRIGCVRGHRTGNEHFTGSIHRERATQWVDASAGGRPDVGLTRAIIEFVRGGPAPIAIAETLELIRFLEAANESRASGGAVVRL